MSASVAISSAAAFVAFSGAAIAGSAAVRPMLNNRILRRLIKPVFLIKNVGMKSSSSAIVSGHDGVESSNIQYIVRGGLGQSSYLVKSLKFIKNEACKFCPNF